MTELDQEVVESDATDDTEYESYTETSEELELTVDDYRKLEERLKKAEKALVEKKKAEKAAKEKQKEVVSEEDEDARLERKLEEREFFKENPEFKGYESELKAYTSKWISIKKAAILVKEDDPSFWNREKTLKMNISNWEPGWNKTTYSIDELEKMSQKDYEKAMWAIESWKAKLK